MSCTMAKFVKVTREASPSENPGNFPLEGCRLLLDMLKQII